MPGSGSFAIDYGSEMRVRKITCRGFTVPRLRYEYPDIPAIPKLFVLPESIANEIML
jgi:hypothetical protein